LSYDITEESVTRKLKDQLIEVVALSTPSGLDDDPGEPGGKPGQASRIAAATGGSHTLGVSIETIVETIFKQIKIQISKPAPPVITEPTDNAQVDSRQVIKGTVPDADKVTLTEAGKDLGTATLTGTNWTFDPDTGGWPVGEHEVQAVAHKGTAESIPAIVHFAVLDQNLAAEYKPMRHWKKEWDKPPFIYSFHLTIHAKKERVIKWTISFDVLKDITVDPDWAETVKDWLKIVDDGTDGHVKIQNIDTAHTIDPDTPLDIDIQLLCPGEDKSYETLHNLIAYQAQ
jgi:hypothetical protein